MKLWIVNFIDGFRLVVAARSEDEAIFEVRDKEWDEEIYNCYELIIPNLSKLRKPRIL